MDCLQGIDVKTHSGTILSLFDDEVYDVARSLKISATL